MSAPHPPRLSPARAAPVVAAALAVAGALIGAAWSWLAPAVHGVVVLNRQGERVKAYLGSESDHFFTAAALLTGMLLVLAVVAAVLLWQWAALRGPVLVGALSAGCALAAAAAAGVGAALVRMRYGAVDVDTAPVTPQQRVHYFTEAPAVFFGHNPLQVAVVILFPAAVAALVYALIAVSTSRDDLGAWPPQDPAGRTGPSGRTGTADDALPVGPPPPSP